MKIFVIHSHHSNNNMHRISTDILRTWNMDIGYSSFFIILQLGLDCTKGSIDSVKTKPTTNEALLLFELAVFRIGKGRIFFVFLVEKIGSHHSNQAKNNIEQECILVTA